MGRRMAKSSWSYTSRACSSLFQSYEYLLMQTDTLFIQDPFSSVNEFSDAAETLCLFKG